jgi:hypothetical protein
MQYLHKYRLDNSFSAYFPQSLEREIIKKIFLQLIYALPSRWAWLSIAKQKHKE